MWPRRISRLSSWPSVHSRPTLTPVFSIRALSATVVPLMHRSQSAMISAGVRPKASAICARPLRMAWVPSWGVDGALNSCTLPLRSAMMKSVKVPPASMPRRYCCLVIYLSSVELTAPRGGLGWRLRRSGRGHRRLRRTPGVPLRSRPGHCARRPVPRPAVDATGCRSRRHRG
ncbi:hypothetical protein D3C87_1481470 [compost metagenome]